MKYKTEFIVCLNDNTWYMTEMDVPEDVVQLGSQDMVHYAIDNGLDKVENVCHIAVMNFYFPGDEDVYWNIE